MKLTDYINPQQKQKDLVTPVDIVIIKGSPAYLSDCVDALEQSDLGLNYFERDGSALAAIQEGLDYGTLYVALYQGVFAGFFYYIPNGAFHSFPYLHLISVKRGCRGMGIGKKMMDFLEDTLLAQNKKIFLVVSDFNPDAMRFYEDLGYCQVGELPNLYRQGISEFLMMKEKKD